MSLYVYPDSHYGLHLGASPEAVARYHEGKRTLVHVPVEWPELQRPKVTQRGPEELDIFALRPLRAGDHVGLYVVPPPRVQMANITSVEAMSLHDMEIGDLVALGRTEQDLEAYRTSWEECWAKDGWPWSSNPEVYAIRWEALS